MSMGWAEEERKEHQAYMNRLDDEAGHSPECHIRYSPPAGGFCSCGVFPSSNMDEYNEKVEQPASFDYSRNDPRAAYLLGFGIVVGVAIGFTVPMILLILVWLGVL